jgi:hypothetical protein
VHRSVHSADAPHRRVKVLTVVVVLKPVAEALAPRKPSIEGGRGPVPARRIGTTYVKAADRCAVVEQDVEFILRRHVLVVTAVRLLRMQALSVFRRLIELHRQRSIGRHRIHGLTGVWRNAGVDGAVGHFVAGCWLQGACVRLGVVCVRRGFWLRRFTIASFCAVKMLRTQVFRDRVKDLNEGVAGALRNRGIDPSEVSNFKMLSDEEIKAFSMDTRRSAARYIPGGGWSRIRNRWSGKEKEW